jgi:outer membrane lipoprotein-sorting protein
MINHYYCKMNFTKTLISALIVLSAAFAPGSIGAELFECKEELTPQRGEELLKGVQAGYSKINSLQAEFFQESYLFALDHSETSRGQMWFEKPGKTRWHYLQPEEQLFVLNEQTVWFYQPQERQAMVDSVSTVFITELPVAFLMGVGNLTRDFALLSTCTTDAGVRFELRPAATGAEEQSELDRFLLLASSDSNLPIGARIFDVGGNTTSILLEQIRTDIEIDRDRFELVLPPNVDLEDRRQREYN